MPEHRIRLRGGWESHHREGDEDGPEVVRRVQLPLIWPEGLPARIKLIRQFGKPPVDWSLEAVSLEMRNVPGLQVTRINGHPVPKPTETGGSWSVVLADPLLPRNGLVLEVDLEAARKQAGDWGEIWLSIRPR